MEDIKAIASAAREILRARSVFVLSGAGLSSPSGLQTFRGTGGYWKNLSVEDLASRSRFEIDPETTWTWYNERITAYLLAEPNAGHRALVGMESLIQGFHHATQLVDGLLERADAVGFSKLHGSVFTVTCTGCDHTSTLAGPMDLDHIEHACGRGRLRPGVVWFGENLPQQTWKIADKASNEAEVIIVVGTSGGVWPANQLAQRKQNTRIVIEINTQPTITDADFTFDSGADITLHEIAEAMKSMNEKSCEIQDTQSRTS